MKTVSKQTVLKGALLAALAANISWSTASTFSTDMASEQGTPRVTLMPAAPKVTIAPVAPNPSAVTTSSTGPQKDAPVAPQVAVKSADEPKLIIPATICGNPYSLIFVEEVREGKTGVRGYVRNSTSATDVISAYSKNITRKQIESSEKMRTQFSNHLVDAVEKKDCATVIADDTTSTPTAPAEQGESPADRRAEEARVLAEKIARGVRECTLDEKGKALDRDGKIDCHIDRLAGAQEEEQDSREDDDRKSRRRSKSRSRGGFAASFEYLMKEATYLLSSEKDSRVDEGEDLRERMLGAIEEADDNGFVSRSTLDTAEARVTNLPKGQKVADRGEQLAKQIGPQAQQIDMQINQLKQQAAQNPAMAQMLDYQIKSLESQKQSLARVLQQDSVFANYGSLLQSGAVGQPEYSVFSKTYEDLIAKLNGQVAQPGQNPISGQPMMQAPQGAQQARAALASQNYRSNGLAMPAYPQNLGIQAASPLISARPM